MATFFLSAVTSEFGSYRRELSNDLRRAEHTVKVQEDFHSGGASLLDLLYYYIEKCDVVVFLHGQRYGAEPPPSAYLKYEDKRRSYTQWEYVFARQKKKPIHVYQPEPAAERDNPNDEPEELTELQSAFWEKEIVEKGKHYSPCVGRDDFIKQVLSLRSEIEKQFPRELSPTEVFWREQRKLFELWD